ncbi:hypothetical protein O7606_07105 [Micromonospora sp. WMMD882]|uniref:hypothetical protein n=1 Tax=Micromonospora sp. WMMD882 TaxID=3015151 RepID=UPI00248B6415|nr:hypothetical protein [Micromonospora sp. WMMD882]WBB81140.1 hypothetical protein O7606_07105 [Micromonospora sp. WMMD882]
MTDDATSPPDDATDPPDDRETARRTAAAATAASRAVESFLRGLPAVPDPAHVAEYANLLSREERAHADRRAAVDALGLTIGSLEPE